jgi:hypothetical protein
MQTKKMGKRVSHLPHIILPLREERLYFEPGKPGREEHMKHQEGQSRHNDIPDGQQHIKRPELAVSHFISVIDNAFR